MKLLFIQSTAPHGTVNAQEGLDAVLMGSAFSECTLLFLAEGVLQLLKDQDTHYLGLKDFSRTFGALRDYGVSRLYCHDQSLANYGISPSDLVIDIESVNDSQIRNLLSEHGKVLNF